MIHSPSAGQCTHYRIQGEVTVGDSGTALMCIEQHTAPATGIVAFEAVVGERAMVDGCADGVIETQTTTTRGSITTLYE